MHLFRLPNCPQFSQYLYVFSQISHLFSNRRARNSAHPFQFVTPDRELHLQPMKNMNFIVWTQPEWNKFPTSTNYLNTQPRKPFNPAEKQTKFGQNALIDPKNKPGKYHSRILHNTMHALDNPFSTIV